MQNPKCSFIFFLHSVFSPLPPDSSSLYAMWCMHQLHQDSYTIKRKPLSALSNVLRKLRHHTASIHEIRHQYEKVRTNTISNVYNSKQGDKGTRNLCRLKLVQEDKSSSYASSMFLKHEAGFSSHGKMHYKVTLEVFIIKFQMWFKASPLLSKGLRKYSFKFHLPIFSFDPHGPGMLF